MWQINAPQSISVLIFLEVIGLTPVQDKISSKYHNTHNQTIATVQWYYKYAPRIKKLSQTHRASATVARQTTVHDIAVGKTNEVEC